jgi:hypothetical protein
MEEIEESRKGTPLSDINLENKGDILNFEHEEKYSSTEEFEFGNFIHNETEDVDKYPNTFLEKFILLLKFIGPGILISVGIINL